MLTKFFLSVENSNQMLKSELNMALREIEASFEAIKRSIPPHVLAMKIKDVRQLNDLNDKVIEEKMTNLNVTVKETVQRADEGKLHRRFIVCCYLCRCFWVLLFIFLILSITNSPSHFFATSRFHLLFQNDFTKTRISYRRRHISIRVRIA